MSSLMVAAARRIYSNACQNAGENRRFTVAVAKLVGTTARDVNDIANRLAAEAAIMAEAARLARDVADGIERLSPAPRGRSQVTK